MMLKVTSVLFGALCIATALLSNSMMGAGPWFWIIIATGVLVASSSFIPALHVLGALLALLLSLVSICAVLLGLVAATIGGSFRLDGEEAILLFLFGLIAIFGIAVVVLNRKRHLRSQQMSREGGSRSL